MDNASKALLIAGAVLIVILLIGIGMLIYSKSTGVIDTASSTMNTQEIQSFNSQFTPYEGSQRGSSVRSLISTVIANNGTYSNEPSKIIDIMPKGLSIGGVDDGYSIKGSNTDGLSSLSSSLRTSDTYKITFSVFQNGLIHEITISK